MSLLAGGVIALVYGIFVERHWFALRRVRVPTLAPGGAAVRVLHLSDLHMLPRHRRKAEWVARLAMLRPDVVVLTGDVIASADAIDPALDALGDLLDVSGAFVYGNNDFYRPEPKSPHRYFTKRTQVRKQTDLPWRELGAALTGRHWCDANNAGHVIVVRGQRIWLAGVNDPHTGRDRFEEIAGLAGVPGGSGSADGECGQGGPEGVGSGADAPGTGAVVRIGLTHSPEPAVLDRFADDGYDIVLAGHTHGGQVRVPGIGALVTNCGLDRSRARGLSRWGARMWLHVSAGLGNSPYLPLRLFCRPEATLVTLVARP